MFLKLQALRLLTNKFGTTAIRYIFSFHRVDVLEEANTPQPVVHGSDGRME